MWFVFNLSRFAKWIYHFEYSIWTELGVDCFVHPYAVRQHPWRYPPLDRTYGGKLDLKEFLEFAIKWAPQFWGIPIYIYIYIIGFKLRLPPTNPCYFRQWDAFIKTYISDWPWWFINNKYAMHCVIVAEKPIWLQTLVYVNFRSVAFHPTLAILLGTSAKEKALCPQEIALRAGLQCYVW